ncbi:MAG: pyruvate ferredoxin oxidoreductase [Prevotellaceae bacterium]|nr:pyruvate ferredoxin oxidoreductase [Prevotellaceae bacterium]
MDYKYIEQLLECYFDCQTTLQEEQILRSFFAQEEVPAHLAQYASLFKYEAEAKEAMLGEEFDKRIMAKITTEERPQRHIIKKSTRLFAPFFKAAAVVAMALTIGNAADSAIGEHEAEEHAGVVAIDPYIKTSDVQRAIRVKDVSKAEMKVVNDSISSITPAEEVQ